MTQYPKAPEADAVVLERSGYLRLLQGQCEVFNEQPSEMDRQTQLRDVASGYSKTPVARPYDRIPSNPDDPCFQARSYTLEIIRRVKVLKPSAKGLASVTMSVPEDAEVQEFSAVTVQPDGQQLVVAPDSYQVESGTLKFQFPEPKVGAVLEYKVQYGSTNLSVVRAWAFQEQLWVKSSSFRLRMLPDWMPVRFAPGKDESLQPTPTIERKTIRGLEWVTLEWALGDVPAAEPGPIAMLMFGQ